MEGGIDRLEELKRWGIFVPSVIVWEKNNWGLFWSYFGYADVFDWLVENGMDVNDCTSKDETVLHKVLHMRGFPSEDNRMELAEHFIAKGVDIHRLDCYNSNALDYAIKRANLLCVTDTNLRLIRILVKCGAHSQRMDYLDLKRNPSDTRGVRYCCALMSCVNLCIPLHLPHRRKDPGALYLPIDLIRRVCDCIVPRTIHPEFF